MSRFSIDGLLPYLVIPVAIYLGMLLLLYLMQSRLIYYPNLPSRDLETTPAALGLEFRSLTISTTDDIRLHAWFLPAEKPRATLLFCHGNAGNISHRLDTLRIFHGLGLNVLIFDYRGYGLSEGSPSESGSYEDAQAVWRYLRDDLGIPADKILIFGRSLGGAVAANLATRYAAGGLILESTFTSVPDLAASLYPFFPVRWLSRFGYHTQQALSSISAPILVAHSPDDEVIPFEHGERLFQSATPPKTFLKLSGGHNDGFLQSGETYIRGLDLFIESLSSSPQS